MMVAWKADVSEQLRTGRTHAKLRFHAGYNREKAYLRAVVGIVANRVRGVEQRIAFHRVSCGPGPLDESSTVADRYCGRSDRLVAYLREISGLQRKDLGKHSSSIFPLVPRGLHHFFLGRAPHSFRVRKRSASRATRAGFYAARQYRALCFPDAVVLW